MSWLETINAVMPQFWIMLQQFQALMRMTHVIYVPFRMEKQAAVEPQFVHQASLFSPKSKTKKGLKNQKMPACG